MRPARQVGTMLLAAAAAAVMAGCSGHGVVHRETPPLQGASTPPSVTSSSPTATSSASSSPPASARHASIDRDDAGRIAVEKYGGHVTSVESDHAKGRATWEVELAKSKQGRIEVDVAKDDGDIVSLEHED